MAEIIAELLKIPPVTRFLCASSLAVSIPVNLGLVSAYKVIIIWQLVTKKWEVCIPLNSKLRGGAELTMLGRYGEYLRVSFWEVRDTATGGVMATCLAD